MNPSEYQYDVAFSFVARDEGLATQLADQFEGRLRVFLYSRRQEQLAGTDGEKVFNEVFGKQARLVVVLYRDGWGDTPWTRIEETAIRNRAFDEGYDFVVFIPLDERPTVPRWLPRSQLWVGLSRWGVAGAASVIDARVQELGGEPTTETIEQKAARIERALSFEKRRKSYLNSHEGVRAAEQSFQELREALLASIPDIEEAAPSLQLKLKQQGRQVVILSTNSALSVSLRIMYANTLSDSILEVSAWHGHPPFPGFQPWEDPHQIGGMDLLPDLAPDDTHAWAAPLKGGTVLLGGGDAAEQILRWWLENHAMPDRG